MSRYRKSEKSAQECEEVEEAVSHWWVFQQLPWKASWKVRDQQARILVVGFRRDAVRGTELAIQNIVCKQRYGTLLVLFAHGFFTKWFPGAPPTPPRTHTPHHVWSCLALP